MKVKKKTKRNIKGTIKRWKEVSNRMKRQKKAGSSSTAFYLEQGSVKLEKLFKLIKKDKRKKARNLYKDLDDMQKTAIPNEVVNALES